MTSIKESCHSQLGLTQPIDSFNGGLRLQDPGQSALVDRIDAFVAKVRSSVEQYPSDEGQLDLRMVCVNTLGESALSCIGKTPLETAMTFQFEIQTQKAPMTKAVGSSPSNIMTKIDVLLERIFIDQFRELINLKLKSRFTSQNKKLQKKKMKKLKQKEQLQEKEREREIEISQ